MSETGQTIDNVEPADQVDPVRGVAAVLAPTWNAIVAPTKALAALAARPRLAWWVLLWVMLGMVGLSLANLDLQRQFMRVGVISSMQQQGQTPDPEQLARMVEGMDRFAPIIAVAQNLFLLVLVLVIAAMLWGGSTLFGGKSDFSRAVAVAAVGSVIHPLLSTAYVALNWRMNPPEIRRVADIANAIPTLSLDLLVGSDQMSFALRAFLMRIDVFNLWWVIVVVMGCERLLGLKRGAAVSLAAGIWLLSALLATFMATFNG